MVTYASSKFLAPSKVELTDAQLEEVHNSVHDLKAVNKQTTPAEMQRLLDEHFFNLSTGSPVEDDGDDEYAPIRNEAPTSVRRTETSIEKTFESPKDNVNETDESTDEALKKLLADL